MNGTSAIRPMNGTSAIALARALSSDPHLTPWEASRLSIIAAKALALMRKEIPKRYVLAMLIDDMEDYTRVNPAAQQCAIVDIAAAIYPCP